MGVAILPWIDILLEKISQEYQLKEPNPAITPPQEADIEYIKSVLANPIGFDADSLIKGSLKNPLKKYSFDQNTILAYTDSIPDVKEWFRIMSCISSKPVRVLFFASEVPRILPKDGKEVEPFNINGGFTNRCSTTDIVIYRKEDALRVLIHELLHGTCSDPDLPLPQLEANTEAWAEIIYVAFKAKGDKARWNILMQEQIKYALQQSKYVQEKYGVQDDSDYGWRYITGRLEVWRALGLNLGDTSQVVSKKPRTLKLTKH